MAERADGRRSWSVRVRILAAILAVAAIGLAVAGGTAYLVERAQTLQSLDDRLLDRVEAARTVVSAASGAVPSADPEPSEDVATAPETTDASISSTSCPAPSSPRRCSGTVGGPSLRAAGGGASASAAATR